jgi:peptidoglycan/xylan/chitin deacetylase (PgdA/CDA1 family)
MYHDVCRGAADDSGFRGPGPGRYKVSAAAFGEHLDALAAAVGEPPAVATVPVLRSRWMLTFDDGGAGALEAARALARRRWRGHFFIVPTLVGTPGFLSWGEVREIAAMGHVIGSHSHTHPPRISACSEQEQRDEWRRSTEAIAERTGAAVTVASVPGGYASRPVAQAAAAAGLEVVFTSTPTMRSATVDGCLVLGRFAILHDTPAARAAQAAAGHKAPWLGRRASWQARAVVKRVAGPHYLRLRSAMLARER